MKTDPKYPDVTVQLVGEDGHAFAIIAAVRKGLIAGGENEAATKWTDTAMGCPNYDALLRLAMATVNVT